MRAKDTESSTATYIVIGLLIAATIIPLATWWYFLNNREFMNSKDLNINNYVSNIYLSQRNKGGKSEFAEHLAKEVKELSYVALSKNIDDKEWQEKLIYIKKEGQKIGS